MVNGTSMNPCQSLGQQRLAATGRADEENVGFRELDIVVLRCRELSRL